MIILKFLLFFYMEKFHKKCFNAKYCYTVKGFRKLERVRFL